MTVAAASSKKSLPPFPEQIWEQRLNRIVQELNALQPLLPTLFYAQQTSAERQYLEQRLRAVVAAMENLQQSLRRIPHVQNTDDPHATAVA